MMGDWPDPAIVNASVMADHNACLAACQAYASGACQGWIYYDAAGSFGPQWDSMCFLRTSSAWVASAQHDTWSGRCITPPPPPNIWKADLSSGGTPLPPYVTTTDGFVLTVLTSPDGGRSTQVRRRRSARCMADASALSIPSPPPHSDHPAESLPRALSQCKSRNRSIPDRLAVRYVSARVACSLFLAVCCSRAALSCSPARFSPAFPGGARIPAGLDMNTTVYHTALPENYGPAMFQDYYFGQGGPCDRFEDGEWNAAYGPPSASYWCQPNGEGG
jgi:hypothetical protein